VRCALVELDCAQVAEGEDQVAKRPRLLFRESQVESALASPITEALSLALSCEDEVVTRTHVMAENAFSRPQQMTNLQVDYYDSDDGYNTETEREQRLEKELGKQWDMAKAQEMGVGYVLELLGQNKETMDAEFASLKVIRHSREFDGAFRSDCHALSAGWVVND